MINWRAEDSDAWGAWNVHATQRELLMMHLPHSTSLVSHWQTKRVKAACCAMPEALCTQYLQRLLEWVRLLDHEFGELGSMRVVLARDHARQEHITWLLPPRLAAACRDDMLLEKYRLVSVMPT